MRWEDIHLDRGEWKIPDKSSKSGFSMTIPLVPEALAILNKRKNNGSEWVFPGPGKTGHVQEPRRTWEAILKRAGLTDVRIHDLRRTVGSWMAAGGASLPTIGKMLGHRNASTTQIYARLDLTSVKTAVTSATAAMMSTAPTAPKQAKKSKVMTYLAHPEK
jgi:integrase